MGFADREDVAELALREMLRVDLSAELVQLVLVEIENRNRSGANPVGLLLTRSSLELIERYGKRIDVLRQTELREDSTKKFKIKRVVIVELAIELSVKGWRDVEIPSGPEANPELF
jgi:hypothetical protein